MDEARGKTIIEKLTDPFIELQTALRQDKEIKAIEDDPNNPIQPNHFFSGWLKLYWYIPLAAVLIIFMIIKKIR